MIPWPASAACQAKGTCVEASGTDSAGTKSPNYSQAEEAGAGTPRGTFLGKVIATMVSFNETLYKHNHEVNNQICLASQIPATTLKKCNYGPLAP